MTALKMSHGTQNYETDNVKFPYVGKINKSVTFSGLPGRQERGEGGRKWGRRGWGGRAQCLPVWRRSE